MKSTEPAIDGSSLKQAVDFSNVSLVSNPISLVFVDPSVENYKALLQGVTPGVKAFLLDALKDGVAQISGLLAEYSEVSILHIVSHGMSGSLQLGTAQLSLDTLQNYQEQLKSWAKALGQGASIALYGCNVAAGDRGSAFVQQLADMLGVDVAASTTPVGSVKKDGNWQLDYTTAPFEPVLAFSQDILESYESVFSTVFYQAEDALLSGVTAVIGNGAIGSYVDYQNASSDYIEWTISVETAGTYDLSWRYANGSGTSTRPLQLDVNGTTLDSSLDFARTSNWSSWAFVTQTVSLQAGVNKIRLTATGNSGANFDYMSVTPITTAPSPAPNVIISDAVAAEGANGFLVFDVALSTASTQPVTLALATDNGTATGGTDFNQALEVSTDGGTTWQAATNNQVTFAAGQTALKVRSAVINDATAETTETMTLRVASVVAGTVGNFADTGTGSITDNDDPPSSTPFDSVFQAENAFLSGPIIRTGNNAQGSFVDYQNATGDFIEWTITVPRAGTYDLSWRYVNAETSLRPLQLDVNQATLVPSLDFPRTSSWSSWRFVTQTVSLQAGENTIRLTATGQSGANFDYMRVVEKAITTPALTVAISNAAATEGANGFLVFDVALSTASTQPVTLALATDNGTATGGTDFNQALEVSTDGGTTWQAATNNQVTFAAGQTALKVRSAVINDATAETTETMTLRVASVVAGTVGNFADTGTGSITDNDSSTPSAPTVTISDATATEGTNSFLVFDVALSGSSTEAITLNLGTNNGTAIGGADFNPALEFSTNGGTSWQAATNNQVTFAAGQTALKVRSAVIDDAIDEPATPETMTLSVGSVVSGVVGSVADTGTGSIIDNDSNLAPGAPITTLPLTDVRVEGELTLDFDGIDGGLVDKDGQGTGFTMVDPASNPGNPNPIGGVVGYWPEKLDVDPTTGVLRITTTPGLWSGPTNNLDNALGIGLNIPSMAVKLETTLINLPTPVGGNAQAGLWLGKASGGGAGSSEDNYIKLVVRSNTNGNYVLETFMEQNGAETGKKVIEIPENQSINLSLFANPANQTVTAQYSVGGGSIQTATTFTNVPSEWFSFDQAGINPEIATRSFGGIFASNRNAPAAQVFTFDKFYVTEQEASAPLPPPPPPTNGITPAFDRWSISVNNATDMSFGPDGKLYVATLFGDIRAITFDMAKRSVVSNVSIGTIRNNFGGNRLTLGIAVDPSSTPDNVVLWVAHSDGSIDNGTLNSGVVSRLSGPGFTTIDNVVTGLPRAIANHGTNNIEFGPDGKLYLWQGGNTGAGAATLAASEFGDRPEQPLSAALLTVDVPAYNAAVASGNRSAFHSDAASPLGEFIDQFYARKKSQLGRAFTEVLVYASGLRNSYDGVFHSNGQIYAPDNGLGVTGTAPPVPRLGSPTDRTKTTLLGENPIDNPGSQPDPLNRIVQGGYYGHPNPYRDEVVFMDGTFQGLSPDPDYKGHMDILGSKLSANGIIEYKADNFFGTLKGDLLITNYSSGDNITRVDLSADGTAVVQKSSLTAGFKDPLPIEMGPNGTIFVGEFNGGRISVLTSTGAWRSDLPVVPQAVLDSGSGVLGGKLYMVGGKTASTHLTNVRVYDPGNPLITTDDAWTTAANLPGPGVENPAVIGLNGKLYAFGGATAPFAGAVNNSAVFTPDTNPDPNIDTSRWDSLAPMPTSRGGATVQAINGDIYVIGGMDASGASVNTVEIYDPETNTWSMGPSMSTRRDNPGSAAIDDKLYVVGGRTRNADGSVLNGTLNTLEIFDPLTGQWSTGAPMPTGRRTFAVGVIDNKMQVVGGEATGSSAFNQNEEYNPLTNSWRTLTSITTARHGAAFGTIDDVLYVAGGGIVAGSSFSDIVQGFAV